MPLGGRKVQEMDGRVAGISFAAVLALGVIFILAPGENRDEKPSSDSIQRQQQERILSEGRSQVGMPSIKNFRERKLLKDIFEMRDQTGLVTYTYLWSDMQGKLIFFCNSIGYGIPYATQFTNPQKPFGNDYHALTTIAQADPNGLFSPASAEGTWVMCKDPNGKDVRPTYVEPRVIVSQFKLH